MSETSFLDRLTTGKFNATRQDMENAEKACNSYSFSYQLTKTKNKQISQHMIKWYPKCQISSSVAPPCIQYSTHCTLNFFKLTFYFYIFCDDKIVLKTLQCFNYRLNQGERLLETDMLYT